MRIFSVLLLIFILSNCSTPKNNQIFVNTDIENFWIAFDSIRSTSDSAKQSEYLNRLFIDKGSVGQKVMMEVRNYTASEYLNAINSYPDFWNSIRDNTLNTATYNLEIEKGVQNLKGIYPDLKPSTVYYTIGVFRSPGTGLDSLVLIGSEFALGDSNTNTKEFPQELAQAKNYYEINPIENIQFLSVHEYVHTQQKEIVNNLLSQSLYEGIAEFVTIKATGQNSPWQAFVYGPNNNETVRQKFEDEMFNFRKTRNWLWSGRNNDFGINDMGYYIGYAIAKRNYEKAKDKKLAIKEMIELDYTNEAQVERFVDGSKYFSATLEELYNRYEEKRPKVSSIKQFKNGSQNVSPNLTEITIEFSEKLDSRYKSTGFGELGKEYFPKVNSIDFSEDGLSVTYKVDLEPNKRYQIFLENGYRTSTDNLLKPYLIDFKTAAK
ncbi:Ig-like domain-containing protein [Fulvivirgaceae bacterium BMA10]|uniref:Ig-like domain-containing protein n=1 Tax=Splendidivirga corallicola TaxID=3051826 RepID=A0ABT8KUQ3_9BACT|nr:Ig-like domain-containing protein [Fulvivirgaceae bacterium BMA10]